jgi:hypothetical protein
VGDVGATPGAAAVQWALRDGAGMVGRIGFAWLQARSASLHPVASCGNLVFSNRTCAP